MHRRRHRRLVNLLARGAVLAGVLVFHIMKILALSTFHATFLICGGYFADARFALYAVGRRVALARSATGLCDVRLRALRGRQAQGDLNSV